MAFASAYICVNARVRRGSLYVLAEASSVINRTQKPPPHLLLLTDWKRRQLFMWNTRTIKFVIIAGFVIDTNEHDIAV